MAWGIRVLKDTFDIRCFFCNPNICPDPEYHKRLDEAHKVSRIMEIPLEADNYHPEAWETAISGSEDTPEQGERCRKCFALRLDRSALYAKDKRIDSLGTVMSVSPHKKIHMINAVGHEAARHHGLEFKEFDLKKQDGFFKSVQLSKDLGIYRQDYCGCRLSLQEREQRAAMRANAIANGRDRQSMN
jgi:hypothetical protein